MTDLNDNGKSKSTSSEEGEECEEDDAVMKDHQATHRIYQQEVSYTSYHLLKALTVGTQMPQWARSGSSDNEIAEIFGLGQRRPASNSTSSG